MADPPHTLRFVLDEFLVKEDLQTLCEDLGLGVDGNREDLVARLVHHPGLDRRRAVGYLDKPQLEELCRLWGLDETGKRDPLQARVLRELRHPEG